MILWKIHSLPLRTPINPSAIGRPRMGTQVAEDLHTGCKGDTEEPDHEWWEKYPGY